MNNINPIVIMLAVGIYLVTGEPKFAGWVFLASVAFEVLDVLLHKIKSR